MNFNCHEQNAKTWETRAESAVNLLCNSEPVITHADAGENILKIGDFGCGNERLRPLLGRTLNRRFEYHGYDLNPHLETTEKIDFEKEMPEFYFDVVFCLGLLEYLNCLEDFFTKLSRICHFCLFSYVVGDSQIYSAEQVSQKGWKHHYLKSEIEAIFKKSNFVTLSSKLIDNNRTCLWLLENQANHSKRS